jgi:serine protease AprX
MVIRLGRPSPRCLSAAAVLLLLAAAVPAAAEHRARLSADLADSVSAGSQQIDVIVHGDRATVDAMATRYNLKVQRYLASGAVLRVNAGQLVALQSDEAIDHLSGDMRIQSLVDAVTAENIGADQVWAGAGIREPLTGRGVSVAVIDSGIDPNHNALKGRVLVTHDFTGGDGVDRYGHGTHVAAIIAGQGGKTADTRALGGIAPGAYLLNLRVLGDDGSGMVSDVIEAIDWTIAHREEFNVRVINLSLGAPVMQPYRDDPLCEAVERAARAGITVIVAAGNYGQTADGKSVYGGIASPANSPHAIAVGATDTHGTAERSDDTLAPYSSKGPTRYDLILKPDVVAPGTHIVSAEAADSYLAKTYPANHVAGSGPNASMQLSGTSMSAGVVSGAVALLLDSRSGLAPRDAHALLQVTSTFLPSAGLIGGGAGIIDVVAAVELAETERLTHTTISGEEVIASGIVTNGRSVGEVQAMAGGRTRVRRGQLVSVTKSNAAPFTIMWGSSADTIVWGTSADTIVWGTSADTIVWGTSADTIVWGTSADTIVWGTSADTIVWGTTSDASALDVPATN